MRDRVSSRVGRAADRTGRAGHRAPARGYSFFPGSRCSGIFGSFHSVAFPPDGSLLAAAAPPDPPVRLWDPPSGQLRLQFAGHARGTVAVAFSPEGRRLATSGNDGMVRLWSLATGELIAALDGRSSWLARIAFSADGRVLVAVGSDNHIRVWEMDDIGEVRVERPAEGR